MMMTFNISADERQASASPSGTQTQVWVDGPRGRDRHPGLHVMKGYLHSPEATAAFTGDWLQTGDLGYFDEDGFLFIVSEKELIIRGGYNVYPSDRMYR